MRQTYGIIILGHGTRRKEAGEMFFSLVDRVALRLGHVRVVPACLSCDRPSLVEQARHLVSDGYSHIVIFPYFLLSGKHIADELPCFVRELKSEFPEISFELLPTMEEEPLLEEIVVTRLLGYMQEDACTEEGDVTVRRRAEEDIAASQVVRLGVPLDHIFLLQGIVHATGDLSLASGMYIHDRAIAAGRSVLRSHGLVLCDSPMISAGLTSMTAELIPGIDLSHTHDLSQCRRFLEKRMPEAIVALGRNPELLDMVVDLVAKGVPEPALVIGLPVGFVDAPHAKQRLTCSGLVCISNAGTRGGVSCVVAMLEALAASRMNAY